MGRIRSVRAHTRPGRSFHIHSEDTRCATGVRRRGRPRFPVSEISRHSNGEPACAVRCTGRTPPVGIVQHVGSPIARVRVTRRGRRDSCGAHGGGGLVRNPDQCLVWRHARLGFDPSQRERPACGWSLFCEGLGRCPRRASSGSHPKRQTPFRVKQEREDGVAFSAPEKPPDACTPAARREGRVAAQCCATTRRRRR
jgi:hypothetical protein